MPRQTAVAFSDVVVAFTAFYCALIPHSYQWAIGGFMLIGVAASVGVFRFGLDRPPPWLVQAHITASWLAKLFGMPALSIAYLNVTPQPLINYQGPLIFSACVTAAVTKLLPHNMKQTPTDAISGLAVIGIVVNSYHSRFYGIMGAVGYLVGGLVLEGNIGEELLSPTASFHYIIAMANIALKWGLMSGKK